MEEISFKYFAKHHLWLLLAVILIPILGIGIYCGLYWQCIDESIVATIVMGVISYVGTIAWGLFIYYNSWSSEQLQKYRDRPRIRVGCVVKENGLPLYTYEEIVGHPLGSNDRYADQFVFLKVRIVNEGNHAIFNVKSEQIFVQVGQRADIKQNTNMNINMNSFNVIAFKEHFEYYVGVLKQVVGDDLEKVNNFITYVLRFQDDLLNIYYCELKVWIKDGKKRFPNTFNLYTESEYEVIKKDRTPIIVHG